MAGTLQIELGELMSCILMYTCIAYVIMLYWLRPIGWALSEALHWMRPIGWTLMAVTHWLGAFDMHNVGCAPLAWRIWMRPNWKRTIGWAHMSIYFC